MRNNFNKVFDEMIIEIDKEIDSKETSSEVCNIVDNYKNKLRLAANKDLESNLPDIDLAIINDITEIIIAECEEDLEKISDERSIAFIKLARILYPDHGKDVVDID